MERKTGSLNCNSRSNTLSDKLRLTNLAGIVFYMKHKGFFANAQYTSDGGFMILKGSFVSPVIHSGCPDRIKKLRVKYEEKIKKDKLVEDIIFGSPSTAASFIAGSSRNGKLAWHDLNKKKLKDILLITHENKRNKGTSSR